MSNHCKVKYQINRDLPRAVAARASSQTTEYFYIYGIEVQLSDQNGKRQMTPSGHRFCY